MVWPEPIEPKMSSRDRRAAEKCIEYNGTSTHRATNKQRKGVRVAGFRQETGFGKETRFDQK